MKLPLTAFSPEPRLPLSTIARLVDIKAETLVAWEEHYELVIPRQIAHGYRLYSERDLAVLWWVKQQMRSGLPITRIAAELRARRESGEVIWVEVPPDDAA